MKPPSFSIVTPAFNSEKTLSTTINAILTQTTPPKEYILIDGGSTDRTVAIAESFRTQFEQKGIRYTIISEKDKGIYDAMNKGVRLVSGDLIGIINSDDWYQPDALELATSTFIKTGYDMMFGDMLVHTKKRTLLKKARLTRWVTSLTWNHPTTFARRALYLAHPYPCQSIYDDFNMYVKMRRMKKKIVVLNKTLANFRMGGVSTQPTWNEVKKRIRIRYRIYRQNGHSRIYLLECIFGETMKYFLS